jgi:hypothetical protein
MKEEDFTLLDVNDVLKHNSQIINRIEEINKEISEKKLEVNKLEKEIIAPCSFCPYDGVYRCESCKEMYYEGFNDKDFGHCDYTEEDHLGFNLDI